MVLRAVWIAHLKKTKTLDYYLSLSYRIVVTPGDVDEGGFVAVIPDLQGCFTQAETWAELGEMIEDAKRGWLEAALELGVEISEPST